jgi:hypothetical protein
MAQRGFAVRGQPLMEQLAAWMIANGFATGHGETMEDLLRHLTWQVEELRARAAFQNDEKPLTAVEAIDRIRAMLEWAPRRAEDTTAYGDGTDTLTRWMDKLDELLERVPKSNDN